MSIRALEEPRTAAAPSLSPAEPRPAGATAAGPALAATLAVLLAIVAVKTLPVPPLGALAALVLFGAGAIALERRPRAAFGLVFPRAEEGGQLLTLAAVAAAPVLALGATQLACRIATGRWLAPLGDPRLELWPYFLGVHVVWSALPEELLFRAYLQTRVRDALGGEAAPALRRGLAAAVVAAVYLVAHLVLVDHRSLLGIGLLGLLLGWLRERTGSVAAPFIGHAAYNATIAWIAVAFA